MAQNKTLLSSTGNHIIAFVAMLFHFDEHNPKLDEGPPGGVDSTPARDHVLSGHFVCGRVQATAGGPITLQCGIVGLVTGEVCLICSRRSTRGSEQTSRSPGLPAILVLSP